MEISDSSEAYEKLEVLQHYFSSCYKKLDDADSGFIFNNQKVI